jgi:hypothetical protein
LEGDGRAGRPARSGAEAGREVPDDHCRPSTALATVQPTVTDAERLAQAGYRGLTRVLREMTWPCVI